MCLLLGVLEPGRFFTQPLQCHCLFPIVEEEGIISLKSKVVAIAHVVGVQDRLGPTELCCGVSDLLDEAMHDF